MTPFSLHTGQLDQRYLQVCPRLELQDPRALPRPDLARIQATLGVELKPLQAF